MNKKSFANLRIWKQLDIGSQRVPVYLASNLLDDHEAFGLAVLSPEYFIVIDRSLSIAQRKRTLVHEVMEVVNDVFDLQLNETGIRCMEQGVCQALKLHGGKDKDPQEKSGKEGGKKEAVKRRTRKGKGS